MPDDLEKRILYRDSNIIILDKPAGLAVHGGPSTPVSLENMLEVLAHGRFGAPQPVHRLDRDTSGCLTLARHAKAVSRLGRLFRTGKVKKCYWAIVEGEMSQDSGFVDLPLRKVNKITGWRMVVDPRGQRAATSWRVAGKSGSKIWLELEPETGRTHQIRVHCAEGLKSPILHDPIYGHGGGVMRLMARRISIPYWAERPPIVIEAPPPSHMRQELSACGWTE
ncbi:RNA pseudouridine synthase [Alphaproteobacteria bacterium]|nr:RNA pseudouridine synthase [Alphaproteobacteria bacterium]